ncbi:MAG: hypothetical protein V8S95_01410 [Odoribacter sp.]
MMVSNGAYYLKVFSGNEKFRALGMTFVCSFSKVIINFRKMPLKVE